MSADYKVHGDVAVISLNNPPVNGFGLSTRQAITEGVEPGARILAEGAVLLNDRFAKQED